MARSRSGLFNAGSETMAVEAKWEDLGISGKYRVRDLWRQQDIGVFELSYLSSVASHGVVLLRLFLEQSLQTASNS